MSQASLEEEAKTWSKKIKDATPKKRPFVTAHTFVKRFDSASKPARLDCDDGNQYVVKALRHDANQGRMLFNDQVVARAGTRIGASVPVVTLVNVPQQLIDLNPCPTTALGHFKAGLAHGSQWLNDVSEDRVNDIKYVANNKQRFAVLSVLYGLMQCSDRQFLYQNAEPFAVYSHDHGHFFPGGPDWSVSGLASATAPSPDNDLITAAGLSSEEVAQACTNLSKLTDGEIASFVAFPPDEWGVLPGDRCSLAAFIAKRRDALLHANKPAK